MILVFTVFTLLFGTIVAQDATTNNWPSPSPTPIPGDGEGGDHGTDHGGDHGGDHAINIATKIAINQFTINVGKIDVDIDKREKFPVVPISGATSSSTSSSSVSPSDDESAVSNTLSSLTPNFLVGGSGSGSGSGSGLGYGPIIGGGKDHGNTNIDTAVQIADFTINVGKIKVDVNKCQNGNKPPTWPIITPLGNDTIVFPDDPVSAEPGSDEVVLGESDVSTQGLPPIGGVSTGPVIYSFTYKISTESNVPLGNTHPLQQVVTFIIRGAHFDITSLLGVDGTELTDGLASLLEPRVLLGAIPLRVVKLTDSYIEARFEDIDDQKSFKAGSYLVRVKVLHVNAIPLLGGAPGSTTISTLGGLSLPELGIIGSGLPVLPIIKSPPIHSPLSLISLFCGFQFDVATLTTTFSSSDADKIAKAAKVIY